MVTKKSLLHYSVILICGEISLLKKSLILETYEEPSWVSRGFYEMELEWNPHEKVRTGTVQGRDFVV